MEVNPPNNRESISLEERDWRVQTIMAKSRLKTNMLFKEPRFLGKRSAELAEEGKVGADLSENDKKSEAVRQIINEFMTNQLKMSEEDISSISMERFNVKTFKDKETTKDMLEIEFSTISDTIKWNKYLHNIRSDESCIKQYIHPLAVKRWQYLDTVAYVMRKKDIILKIREGKSDFYILGKSKYDRTPWKEINHDMVPEGAPDFDIGVLNQEDRKTLTDRDNYKRSKIADKLIEVDDAIEVDGAVDLES